MSIRYIKIQKSYSENKKKNYNYASIDNFVKLISTKNISSSIFEVLRNEDLKIFFDIEKIPKDQTNFIYDIIGDLKTWFAKETKQELGDFILTFNKDSNNHEGLSYHIIFFEWFTNMNNIRNLLNNFLEEHSEYVPYMDGSVYSKDRLFKSINQIGVNNKTKKLSDSLDDIHEIINKETNDETIKQSIIQNVNNSKLLEYNFKYVNRPKAKKISNFNNFKQKPVIIIHNHIGNNKEKDDQPVLQRATKETLDDDIYSKAFALKLKNVLNEYGKEYIDNLLEYYNKNKTFDGYEQSKYQIMSILNLLE